MFYIISDKKIIRNTEKKAFKKLVHRKSMSTGVLTNFKTFILITHKIWMFSNMFFL